jgi:hypothetical protein
MSTKKINICLDFNDVPPLSRWSNSFWNNNLFGQNNNLNFIKWEDFKNEENNYLFLYCVPDDTIKFLESKEDSFFKNLKDKKIKLLFFNEQFNLFMFNKNIFEYNYNIKHNCYDINDILYWKILNIFEKHNIKEETLFFIHSAKGFLDEIEEMKQRKILWLDSTWNTKSKHLQIHSDLAWGRDQLIQIKDIQLSKDKPLRYHYACLFGGRPSPHRHNLIKKLWGKQLLNQGKCSLTPLLEPADHSEFKNISLPEHGIINTHSRHPHNNEIEMFEDIFLWVAAETYCQNGYPYFTEKTIKAIVYERPFITYGNPGTLAYLKDYGFKSFGNFWDESYDDEKDDNKKIEMIADIIENICQKNLEEINQMYNKMKPIIQFNKDLLFDTDWRQDLIKFLL